MRPELTERDRGAPALTAVAVGTVVAVGAVVRLAGIGDRSLWIDESFSIWLAALPLRTAWTITAGVDMHPPLYYTLLHLWSGLGDGEGTARGLSALFGTLTIPVMYLIGARIGGRTLGLVAAGLLALSPLQVYYAQQARMYTMLTFFAAGAVLAALQLLDAPAPPEGRRWPGPWWWCLVLATLFAVLSHNAGVLLPATLALFAATAAVATAGGRATRRHRFVGLPGIATGLGAALLLWLPWLPGFAYQTRRVDAEFWLPAPTLEAVLQHWRNLALAYGPGGPWLLPIAAGVLALAALGAWSLRSRPLVPCLLGLLVLAPVVAELVISIRRPIFYTQTLVWTAVPLCALLAAGLLRLRPPPLAVAGCLAAVVLQAGALAGYARDPGFEDWRSATGYVAARAQPGDLLLFNAGWTTIPFGYYWARQDSPPAERHGLPVDLFERGILEPKMTSADLPRLDELTAGRSRVWLIYSHDWYTDPAGLIPARLAERFGDVELREFSGIRVYRYADSAG